MQFKTEKLGKELGNRCLVSIYCVFTAGRITSWVFPKKRRFGTQSLQRNVDAGAGMARTQWGPQLQKEVGRRGWGVHLHI